LWKVNERAISIFTYAELEFRCAEKCHRINSNNIVEKLLKFPTV